jgi:plastocyanin domain-containing protein
MGAFALGTVPGLLSLGGLTSFAKGIFAKRFFKVLGLTLIAFALFNIVNGFGLTGITVVSSNSTEQVASVDSNVVIEDGVQIVTMKETNRGYEPNSFTIKKDLPVKWVIDAQAPYSCASSILMPKYNIRQNLVSGENIIKFTPTEIGQIKFSCSMGMYTGAFNVVE